MNSHITTADAKSQGLPGHDVYRYSHLVYHGDVNRDAAAVRLNLEALKAFSDTILVSQRAALAAERATVADWQGRGGMESGLPVPYAPALTASMQYINYENLKIAAGFELHLKARLLARDFIVHEIDPKTKNCGNLAKRQPERPIKKQELFAIQEYRFDGKQNYLPGLKEASLKFSLLTDEASYRAALDLTDQQLNIIRDYRRLRNQIHFPGDFVEVPSLQAHPAPIVDLIVSFINTEVIDWSNKLIADHQLRFRPLDSLS